MTFSNKNGFCFARISFVSRPWSFSRSASTALPCVPPRLYRWQWMEEERMRSQSQIPLPEEFSGRNTKISIRNPKTLRRKYKNCRKKSAKLWRESKKSGRHLKMDGGGKNDEPVTNPITNRGGEEKTEINLFPITWEILFVQLQRNPVPNQNKSSSTALLCSHPVVLQPFQPRNWRTLPVKQINCKLKLLWYLISFSIQIKSWQGQQPKILSVYCRLG